MFAHRLNSTTIIRQKMHVLKVGSGYFQHFFDSKLVQILQVGATKGAATVSCQMSLLTDITDYFHHALSAVTDKKV